MKLENDVLQTLAYLYIFTLNLPATYVTYVLMPDIEAKLGNSSGDDLPSLQKIVKVLILARIGCSNHLPVCSSILPFSLPDPKWTLKSN